MNTMIIYRPYKTHAWILPFIAFVGPLAFVVAGYCVPYWGVRVLVLAAVGITCAWLTKILYDTSNLSVIFEKEGLRIVGGSYKNYRYVLWKEVPYAYYSRNFKGHLFLVLSPNMLSLKETRIYTNRGASSSRICIDGVLVIYIDIFQDVSKIKELIDLHVVHVDTY